MAKMHSGKKGNSGSKPPIKKENPVWMSYSAKEVELLIVKFAKEGRVASEIGLVLRDNYGIPSVKTLTKKTITKILEEKKLTKEIPEDLMALIKKSIVEKKHIEANGQDKTGKRGLQLTESKIRRLIKYYIRAKKLPQGWKYDPEKIKLMIE